MDAPHPLLKAVRIPRDVVVEHYVADLEVDPFPGCLGGDKDLDIPVAELLF